MARALIARGADVNALTARGFSPLMFAAAEATPRSPGARRDGRRPRGAHGGDRAAADGLAPQRGDDGNPRRLRENQALLISQLPQDGDSEPRRPQGGFTPLLYAAMSGDLDTVRVLVSAGADVDETAADGTTPLIVTLQRGIEEGLWRLPGGRNQHVAAYLLAHGADPNLSEAGYAALHVAAATGQREAVEALLEHAPTPNDRQFADAAAVHQRDDPRATPI